MNFLLIFIGLGLLIFGGSWLLKSAVSISLKLKIPRVVIGMTVVSFATSAPELIVSINAALNNSSDLALSNVVGSNIANLGLVLGVTLLFGSIYVSKSFYKTDWPVMMLSSILLYFFLLNDATITFWEGLLLFSLLIFFLFYLLRFQKHVEIEEIEEETDLSSAKTFLFLVLGGVGLWGGSELLIKGAVSLAEDFGVTERVIGITVVSIGTSIPELAASVIAMIKKEKSISLGNLLGSNMFNILAVLGITSLITPISLADNRLLTNDIYWMLGISFIILPFVLIPKKMVLSYRVGIILLFSYGFFMYSTL